MSVLGFSYLHIVGLLSTLKANREEKEAQRAESVTVETWERLQMHEEHRSTEWPQPHHDSWFRSRMAWVHHSTFPGLQDWGRGWCQCWLHQSCMQADVVLGAVRAERVGKENEYTKHRCPDRWRESLSGCLASSVLRRPSWGHSVWISASFHFVLFYNRDISSSQKSKSNRRRFRAVQIHSRPFQPWFCIRIISRTL